MTPSHQGPEPPRIQSPYSELPNPLTKTPHTLKKIKIFHNYYDDKIFYKYETKEKFEVEVNKFIYNPHIRIFDIQYKVTHNPNSNGIHESILVVYQEC